MFTIMIRKLFLNLSNHFRELRKTPVFAMRGRPLTKQQNTTDGMLLTTHHHLRMGCFLQTPTALREVSHSHKMTTQQRFVNQHRQTFAKLNPRHVPVYSMQGNVSKLGQDA